MKNDFPYVEVILNTGDMKIDPGYQRKFQPTKVARILKEFDPVLVNPPKVSFRDGKYWIFDGQHTVAALKGRNGGKDLNVRCRVYQGMTQLDESRYFLLQNGVSSPVTGNDKLHAMFNMGDKDVLGMVRASEKCGFTVDFKKGPGRGHIIATSALYKLYKALSIDQFMSMLNIIKNACGLDQESLRGEILNGVGIFVNTYDGQFKQKALERSLANVQPIAIVRDGRGLSGNNRDNACFARAILRVYNKNRTTNRLEDKM